MTRGARVFVTDAASYTCKGVTPGVLWTAARASDVGGTVPYHFPALAPDCGRRLSSSNRLATYFLAAIDESLREFLDGVVRSGVICGVALGSAYGHLSSYFDYYKGGTEQGYYAVNPRLFPATLPNACSVAVNSAYGLLGCSTAICSGLSAGLEAVAYAADAVRYGVEEAMLAGGGDEITPFNMEALRHTCGESPTGSIDPMSADRDGTIAGEGIGVVAVQNESGAAPDKRLAEICGFACSHFSHDRQACDKAAAAIRSALCESSVEPEQIGAIFSSANGSSAGDEFESMLLERVFGPTLNRIPIVAVKKVTGECFAGAGPLQLIAALAPEYADAGPVLVYTAPFDGTLAALVARRARSL